MRTILPLRTSAIVCNVFFIARATRGVLHPVRVLHCLPLPFDIHRR